MKAGAIDLSFPANWSADILAQRPAILPSRHFTYPRMAEEVERGALEVMVRPRSDVSFLATFALGFADPAVPAGVWSCPNPDELCAVAGGYAYVVRTSAPQEFTQIALRPVLEIRAIPDHNLLLFAGHQTLIGWGVKGQSWQTARLSAEGLRLTEVRGHLLHGFGWDLLTDRDVPFAIDLRTGAHQAPDSEPDW